ncbi:VOC family protein [Paracoccus tegillarcae]|uniref:Polyphosphate kinase n=1 Tax=Paracoccus tegillarcae TaxID=1529068 RepID=A0A2K9EUN1_9RHOB|nr:VOC family protein [Paracoccus tegillarcae]AUH34576.1 polyphosphate kinase [Paracoccus tegillarcae]
MAAPAFDHIVIAAETLAEGEVWLTDLLGAAPEPGGKHGFMGTHNRLWRLGDREYLELIAIDPDATPPPYPRWFGLDQFGGPPRLVAWVIRTSPLQPQPSSSVMQAARGDLRWQITIPDSGTSAQDGVAPLQIDWGDGPHPADRMPDHGLRLTGLNLAHAKQPAILPDDPRIKVRTGAARLTARLSTPRGEVVL